MKHKSTGRRKEERAPLGTIVKNINSSPLLLFFVKLNLFAIPLYAVLVTGVKLEPLMQLTTHLSYALLRISGIDAQLKDYIISVPVSNGDFGAYVSWDSTGWKSMLALAALILATHSTSRKKIYGLLLVPFVYLVNILRVWFMFFIATVNPSYFELAHITVWSWGMILAVLLLWIIWMKKR